MIAKHYDVHLRSILLYFMRIKHAALSAEIQTHAVVRGQTREEHWLRRAHATSEFDMLQGQYTLLSRHWWSGRAKKCQCDTLGACEGPPWSTTLGRDHKIVHLNESRLGFQALFVRQNCCSVDAFRRHARSHIARARTQYPIFFKKQASIYFLLMQYVLACNRQSMVLVPPKGHSVAAPAVRNDHNVRMQGSL